MTDESWQATARKLGVTLRHAFSVVSVVVAASCSRSNGREVLRVPLLEARPVASRKPFDEPSTGSAWAGLNGLAVRRARMVIADPQAPGLFVLDSLSALPRRFGTGGDGPNEMRRPRSVVWTSDSTVLVHDYQRLALFEWNVQTGDLVRRVDLRGRPSVFRFLGRLLLGVNGQVLAAPWEEPLEREIPANERNAPVIIVLDSVPGRVVRGWGRAELAPGSQSGRLASAWERGDAFILGDTLHRLRSRDGVVELYDLRSSSASPIASRSLAGFFVPRAPREVPSGGTRTYVLFDPLFESATRLQDGRYVAVANTREFQDPSEGLWPAQVLAVYGADGDYEWGARLPGGVYRWLQASGDSVYVLGFDSRKSAVAERALQVFVVPATSKQGGTR